MILRESIAANSREGKFQFRVRQNNLQRFPFDPIRDFTRWTIIEFALYGFYPRFTANSIQRFRTPILRSCSVAMFLYQSLIVC